MKKKRPTIPNLTKLTPSPTLLFILLMALLVAFCAVTYVQNTRIRELQDIIDRPGALANIDQDQQKMLPACERETDGSSIVGGNGQKVLSVEGNDIRIESYQDQVFHICDNVTVYDIVNGGTIDKSEIKPGVRIWTRTTVANHIKEIDLVSRN